MIEVAEKLIRMLSFDIPRVERGFREMPQIESDDGRGLDFIAAATT